jgi:hypothetical protein
MHLEHAFGTQGAELEEKMEIIANIKQQLLELHEQAPPTPEDHEEVDAISVSMRTNSR